MSSNIVYSESKASLAELSLTLLGWRVRVADVNLVTDFRQAAAKKWVDGLTFLVFNFFPFIFETENNIYLGLAYLCLNLIMIP